MMRSKGFVATYLVVFAIMGVAAFVGTRESVATVVSMLTFGLGAYLLSIPVNIAKWMLFGLPFALSFPLGRWAMVLGAVTSVTLAYLYLFEPVEAAREEMAQELALLTQNDRVIPLEQQTLDGIELRKNSDGFHVLECHALCRGLLVGGHTTWVRVVVIKKSGLLCRVCMSLVRAHFAVRHNVARWWRMIVVPWRILS